MYKVVNMEVCICKQPVCTIRKLICIELSQSLFKLSVTDVMIRIYRAKQNNPITALHICSETSCLLRTLMTTKRFFFKSQAR